MPDYEQEEWVEPDLFNNGKTWGVRDAIATDNAEPGSNIAVRIIMTLAAVCVVTIAIVGYSAFQIMFH
jgi:hypothetical protein